MDHKIIGVCVTIQITTACAVCIYDMGRVKYNVYTRKPQKKTLGAERRKVGLKYQDLK